MVETLGGKKTKFYDLGEIGTYGSIFDQKKLSQLSKPIPIDLLDPKTVVGTKNTNDRYSTVLYSTVYSIIIREI